MSKASTAHEFPQADASGRSVLVPSSTAEDPEQRLAELLQRFERRAALTRSWLEADPAEETQRDETARRAGKVLAEALDRLAELPFDLPPAEERAREAMRSRRPKPSEREAVRRAAEERVFELEMVGAGEAAQLLGAKSSNREKVRLLRVEGVLLGLPRSNRALTHYLYPTFQFDRTRRTVHAAVAQVNKLLGALDDPWGVASWWVSPDGWLGDAPHRCVSERPHDVVAAAEAATEWLG